MQSIKNIKYYLLIVFPIFARIGWKGPFGYQLANYLLHENHEVLTKMDGLFKYVRSGRTGYEASSCHG